MTRSHCHVTTLDPLLRTGDRIERLKRRCRALPGSCRGWPLPTWTRFSADDTGSVNVRLTAACRAPARTASVRVRLVVEEIGKLNDSENEHEKDGRDDDELDERLAFLISPEVSHSHV